MLLSASTNSKYQLRSIGGIAPHSDDSNNHWDKRNVKTYSRNSTSATDTAETFKTSISNNKSNTLKDSHPRDDISSKVSTKNEELKKQKFHLPNTKLTTNTSQKSTLNSNVQKTQNTKLKTNIQNTSTEKKQ